jgi:hypothetical protein
MRKPLDKDAKILKWRQHLDAAETMRAIMEHPAYAGFFNAYDAEITNKMRNAVIEDDTTRRNAAIELMVLNKFRSHLADVAQRGERAKRELEAMEAEQNAG